jgi:serine/threonine-protein kinase RsbW
MICPRTYHRMFPGVPESVAAARRFAAAALVGCPAAEDAVLAVSELASNAVSWSRSGELGGWFVVQLAVTPRVGAVVYVSDLGPAAGRPAGSEGGRGLRIVAAISQAWGVARGDCSASAGRVHAEPGEAARLAGAGQCVWFSVGWEPTAVPVAAVVPRDLAAALRAGQQARAEAAGLVIAGGAR